MVEKHVSEKNFISSSYLRNVLFLGQVFGAFPFSFKNGKFRRCCKLALVTFCMVTFALSISILYASKHRSPSKETSMVRLLFVSGTLTLPLIITINIWLASLRIKQLDSFLSCIKASDNILRIVGMTPADKVFPTHFILDGCFLIICVLLVLLYIFYHNSLMKIYLTVYYIFVIFCFRFTVWQFSAFCNLLNGRFDMVCLHLKEVSSTVHYDGRVKKIKSLSLAYNYLISACTNLQRAYTKQLFLAVINCFIQMIINIFFLLYNLIDVHHYSISYSHSIKRICWAIAFAIPILEIVIPSEFLTRKVCHL